jgi:hypothetical protein
MRGAAEFEVVLIKIWLLRPLSLYRGMIRLESRVGPALQFEGGYRGLDEQVKFPWPSYESSAQDVFQHDETAAKPVRKGAPVDWTRVRPVFE